MSKQPVSINGIEFDALVSIDNQFTQEIPDYPTEKGFSVSDTIIFRPRIVNLTVIIANVPATWKGRHGISMNRVIDIEGQLKKLYFSRELVTLKTSDETYQNMGVTTMNISKTNNSTRTISLALKEVYVTERQITSIPDYSYKSGQTEEKAGKAATTSSSKSTGSGTQSPVKSQSVLYGAASGLGFL